MFREYELVIWSCFSLPKEVSDLLDDCLDDTPSERIKSLLNHLVNTAYYCKHQITSEEEFEPFKAFFNNYF